MLADISAVAIYSKPCMPRTITDGQAFPMRCPACDQVEGMPFMAATVIEGDVIRVGMRCRKCDHEWRFDMPVTIDRSRQSIETR